MTLILNLDSNSETPLYRQIYRQIRDKILDGSLPTGSRLPASRKLASSHGLARITVTQAYDQLQSEGYLDRKRGAGTFVADIRLTPRHLNGNVNGNGRHQQSPLFSQWGQRLHSQNARATTPFKNGRYEVDFQLGQPLREVFPYDVWRRLLARYLSTDDSILSRYGSAAGFLPLRQALAEYLQRMRSVRCTPEQIVIVSGVQQAVDILARLLLNPGEQVLVETPGYMDVYHLLRTYGAQLRSLSVDDAGIPAERLTPGLTARMAFVTPSNQFPRGGALPLARRLALLRWATVNNAYVIEDDYDGELRYRGRPLATLQGLDTNERVVYVGSFSKVLFPTLRLGYVVLPEPLLQPFIRTKALIDRGAPTLTQAAVNDFIQEGHFERHLRRLRNTYGARRDTLVEAIDAKLGDLVTYVNEPAGLHIMLSLLHHANESEIVRRAAARGVKVYPGSTYHLEQPSPASLLLGFSAIDEPAIEYGIAQLAEVLQQTAPSLVRI